MLPNKNIRQTKIPTDPIKTQIRIDTNMNINNKLNMNMNINKIEM